MRESERVRVSVSVSVSAGVGVRAIEKQRDRRDRKTRERERDKKKKKREKRELELGCLAQYWYEPLGQGQLQSFQADSSASATRSRAYITTRQRNGVRDKSNPAIAAGEAQAFKGSLELG